MQEMMQQGSELWLERVLVELCWVSLVQPLMQEGCGIWLMRVQVMDCWGKGQGVTMLWLSAAAHT